jgi:ADP-heptose:LPS heptosyltransferase
MGLGGYLTWTAVSREIVKSGKARRTLPCEIHEGQYLKIVQSDIWKNNPYMTTDYREYEQGNALLLQLNNPDTNYCKVDTPTKCQQRSDKHCIRQICEYYDVKDPELRCEIFLTDEEKSKVERLTSELQDKFVIIEPHSKKDYTPNKEYSFEKWQKIVNKVSKYVQIVQIGNKKEKILDNVVNLVGKTTFREASGIIGKSCLFASTEGGLIHAATAAHTTSLVILTGFGDPKLWSYPQNINVYIGKHGPCGLKVPCWECLKDVEEHDETEIINLILSHLEK